MNKQAAEKIASDYYTVGVQLALQEAGLTKTANRGRALAALGLGGGGVSLGTGVSGDALMSALKTVDPRLGMSNFDPALLKAIMTGAKQDVAGYGAAVGRGAQSVGAGASEILAKLQSGGREGLDAVDTFLSKIPGSETFGNTLGRMLP